MNNKVIEAAAFQIENVIILGELSMRFIEEHGLTEKFNQFIKENIQQYTSDKQNLN